MQIYGEKSAEFLNFAELLGSFEEIEWMDSENYSDNNAARRL